MTLCRRHRTEGSYLVELVRTGKVDDDTVPVHVCVVGCGSGTVRGSGLCTTACTERGHNLLLV